MKRLMAVLMSLALVLMCFAACAENAEKTNLGKVDMNGAFELRCALPEGYGIQERTADQIRFMAVIASADETKPVMVLSIAYDELLSSVDRLNDLDSDALAQIEATFREEDEVEIIYCETSHGTKLMMVKETKGGVNYVDFYTIYKGYSIEFVLTRALEVTDAAITEDEIRMAVEFLSDLDFIPAGDPQ